MEFKKYKRGKLLLALALDRVVRPFFAIARLFTRRLKPDGFRWARCDRIVVLQTGAVGDVVMSLPALRVLRAHYPNSRISLVAGPWAEALLAGEGDLVNDVVSLRAPWLGRSSLLEWIRFWRRGFRLRRERYDLGVDLRGDPRSLLFLFLTGAAERVSYGWHGARLGEYLLTRVVPGPEPSAHLVDRFLTVVTALDCEPTARTPRLHVVYDERLAALEWRRGVLARTGGDRLVGIHPGAANPLRHWSSERFAVLASRLASLGGVSVVVFAGPAEEATAREIARLWQGPTELVQLPLRDFIVRASALDVLVALDSSPAHIGAALDVPVVVLFGPALPAFVGPIGTSVRIVQEGQFECRPCTQERCVHPEASCMDAIRVDVVLSAVTDLLSIHRGTHEEQVVRAQPESHSAMPVRHKAAD